MKGGSRGTICSRPKEIAVEVARHRDLDGACRHREGNERHQSPAQAFDAVAGFQHVADEAHEQRAETQADDIEHQHQDRGRGGARARRGQILHQRQ